MAQTAQMTRPKEATSNWSSTFPAVQNSQSQSTMFMKKLLAVAVSEILYLRAVFPEKAFGDRKVEDLNLKILTESSNIHGPSQVIQWMRGCFEALEKKYLRQIQLAVYLNENEPDEAVESYNFRFDYNDNKTSITCNNKEVGSLPTGPQSSASIRKATLSLLRTTVMLTNHLDPLPNPAYLGMKLLYYDNVTPPDYEPEGFKSCDVPTYSFIKETLNMKVGEVNTVFHSMKLRVKTDRTQFNEDNEFISNNEPIIPSPMSTVPTVNLDENEASKNANEKSPKKSPMECDENQNSSPHTMESIPSTSTATVASSPDHVSDGSDSLHSMGGLVRCPCNDMEDDGLMVQCVACGYWQHGICFAVKNEADTPKNHYCNICANENSPKRIPTDFYLHSLDAVEQKKLCLWRRTLLTCLELRSLTEQHLNNKLDVSMEEAKTLIERLEKEGFVMKAEGRVKNRKMIKKDALKSVAIPRYLTRQKNKNPPSNTLSSLCIEFSPSASKSASQDNNEMIDLVKDTQKLSVLQTKPVLKNTRGNVKRKQSFNLDVNFNDSQDSLSQNASQSSKRVKSSASLHGLQV